MPGFTLFGSLGEVSCEHENLATSSEQIILDILCTSFKHLVHCCLPLSPIVDLLLI